LSEEQLQVLRTCALLHDIGKLECWANRKPWSEHIHWTYKFVKDCLDEDFAQICMRHHRGFSYSNEYHPKSEFEKIICLADNFSAGADRREQPEHGSPFPKLPVVLTHVLSDGNIVRSSFDAARLAYVSNVLRTRIKEVGSNFAEHPKDTYHRIFVILENSELRRIPADTRKPVNDVSLWNHLKLSAAFATCIFAGGGYNGDNYEKYDFALLSGDADWISRYVNLSRRLPDLNARSERIKKATKDVVELLADLLGPECIIYAGGGSFLALSPLKMAENVIEKAKCKFEESTGGEVTMTVNHVVVGGKEILENFGACWERAQHGMRVKKNEREIPPIRPVEESVDVCDVCRRRPATREDEQKIMRIDAAPRPERLCDVCWSLRREGKGAALDDLREKTNFVAVIKADGDNIGKVLRGDKFEELGKVNTPSRLSALSDIINMICEDKLEEVIEQYGGKCVYAGGDDLLAFVSGERALEASRAIGLAFRNETAEKCSMSIGVAIFRYDLPVYVGLETVDYLLKRVKEEGKGKVAFAIVGGSGITSSELRKYVKLRTLDEVNDLLNIAKSIGGVSSSQVRRVANLSLSQPDKAEVLVKYLIGRGVVSWEEGKKLLSFLEKGLLTEALIIHNLFKGI